MEQSIATDLMIKVEGVGLLRLFLELNLADLCSFLEILDFIEFSSIDDGILVLKTPLVSFLLVIFYLLKDAQVLEQLQEGKGLLHLNPLFLLLKACIDHQCLVNDILEFPRVHFTAIATHILEDLGHELIRELLLRSLLSSKLSLILGQESAKARPFKESLVGLELPVYDSHGFHEVEDSVGYIEVQICLLALLINEIFFQLGKHVRDDIMLFHEMVLLLEAIHDLLDEEEG